MRPLGVLSVAPKEGRLFQFLVGVESWAAIQQSSHENNENVHFSLPIAIFLSRLDETV